MRKTYLKRRYGTNLVQMETLLANQDERCAICLRHWTWCPPAKIACFDEDHFLQHLTVDHDHRTGAIRGLLCNACNTALGLFDECLDRFRAAIAYLEMDRPGLEPATSPLPEVTLRHRPTTQAPKPERPGGHEVRDGDLVSNQR
jgi:hypothetical protein